MVATEHADMDTRGHRIDLCWLTSKHDVRIPIRKCDTRASAHPKVRPDPQTKTAGKLILESEARLGNYHSPSKRPSAAAVRAGQQRSN